MTNCLLRNKKDGVAVFFVCFLLFGVQYLKVKFVSWARCACAVVRLTHKVKGAGRSLQKPTRAKKSKIAAGGRAPNKMVIAPLWRGEI